MISEKECKCGCGLKANYGGWITGHWNRGKHRQFSEEHRRNMGLSQRGRKHSEETKRKMRKPKTEAHRQKLRIWKSDETRKKISLTLKRKYSSGELINPMTGKKHLSLAKKIFESSEYRSSVSNRLKRFYEDPKNKIKTSEAIKKAIAAMDPFKKREMYKKISESVKKSWEGIGGQRIRAALRDPLIKQKMCDAQRKRFSDPEQRRLLVEKTKTPEILERLALKSRLRRQLQMEETGILWPTISKYESPIIEGLSRALGAKIIQQQKVIGYYLDGYCPRYNLAVEIDEPRHYCSDGSLKEKDQERQRRIEQHLNCQFLRIPLSKITTMPQGAE